MANFLTSIQPHQVSRDLKGYSILMYGTPKSGKTTTACKFPKPLLLAFEKGYSTIPGVRAYPINSWGDFRKVLIALRDQDTKDEFDNIIIDTADIAYEYCVKYICDAHNVEEIRQLPYGQGYDLVKKEFDSSLRKIAQLDYGLILISHATEKSVTNEKNEEYTQMMPTLDKRGREVCERMCDIIGLTMPTVDTTLDKPVTKMYMRETRRYMAGSRFKYTPDSIILSYENLANAIGDAIDKEAQEHDNTLVTNESVNLYKNTEKTFNLEEIRTECQTLISGLMSKSADNRPKISKILTEYLGAGKKIADVTESQAEVLDVVLAELKKL